VPPWANSETWALLPIVWSLIVEKVKASACGELLATLSAKTLETVPFEPATCAVNDDVEVPFGLPVIFPLDESDSPDGKDPLITFQVQPLPQPGALSV
jgi:hypothetical protein